MPEDGFNLAEAAPEALLQRMIAFESVNAEQGGRPDAEAQLGEWLARLAERAGLDVQRLPVAAELAHPADNVLVVAESGTDRPWLLFDSHLDTVSAAGMSAPFAGRKKEGFIHGRGACDTKGTGAAMLTALRDYAARPRAERPANVGVLLSVDEEASMKGARSFLANDLPALGIEPAAVIVGEPTDCHPVVTHMGLVRWTLTTHGHSAHACLPSQGRNAISSMARAIVAIEDRYVASLTADDRMAGPAACSINVIRGGEAVNTVPAACEARIDRRIVPGEDPSAPLEAVASVLETERGRVPELAFTQTLDVQHPPLTSVRNRALAERFRSLLREARLPAMSVGAPFCSHGGRYDEAGYATVVFGPGDSSTAHRENERIAVEDLRTGAILYETMMRSLPGPDTPG